jgi:hypothetical protein
LVAVDRSGTAAGTDFTTPHARTIVSVRDGQQAFFRDGT